MDKKVQEALQVINNMRRNFTGTGEEHDVTRQAIEVIVAACTPKPKKKRKPKEPKE